MSRLTEDYQLVKDNTHTSELNGRPLRMLPGLHGSGSDVI
jgi:hypothetical protein